MNLDAKALSGFIKEIEDSRDRQKGETDFQRDVFKRAKEKHFDTKAMRIVLQRRAMDAGARDEQDYNVQAYELALGAKKLAVEAMEQGASAREAAKAHGLPRAAVTALKPGTENTNFEPPEEGGDRQSASRGGEESADVTTASASSPPPITEPCGGVESRHAARAEAGHRLPVSDSRGTDSGHANPSRSEAGVAPGPQANSDGMDIPAHLRAHFRRTA